MKLVELLTENLGSLKKSVGSRLASLIPWNAILGKGPTGKLSKIGTNSKIEKLAAASSEQIRKKYLDDDAIQGGVISIKGRPVFFFAETGGNISVFFDFTGLLDDEEVEEIEQDFVVKDLGHKAGRILFNDFSEFQQDLLSRLVTLEVTDKFDVDFVLIDEEKFMKQKARAAKGIADREKAYIDNLPAKSKKDYLRKKHGHKFTTSGTVTKSEMIRAMRALDFPNEYVNEIRAILVTNHDYTADDIQKKFDSVDLGHYAEDLIELFLDMDKFKRT